MAPKRAIYLDYAAATPLDKYVLAAMKPYFADRFYNPSATYLAAKGVSADIEEARGRVAQWLGARPAEIIFTAGGTEANNLALKGVLEQFPGSNVVVSTIEHDSVLEPAGRYDCRRVPVQPDGLIDMSQLEKAIDDKTVLVSVVYANNEIGTVQPIRRIAQQIALVRDGRHKMGHFLPLYLHTDACQAGNYLDLHAKRLGVDLMTLNGGKIYGPKQSGALFVKTGVNLKPLIEGGGQERGLRSGTENVAGIIGFSAALEKAQAEHREESKRAEALRDDFIIKIKESFKNASINGSLKHRLANNVHVSFPGQDNERMMMALDEAGIECAVGSACSASSDEPSHVLKAIGLSDNAARASLRFTLGRQTTKADIHRVITALKQIVIQ